MPPINRKPQTAGLLLACALSLTGCSKAEQPAADPAKAATAAAPAASAGKPALTVSLTQASQSQVPLSLVANGSVAAWQEASVGAEVNGLRIQALHAQVGDQVQRGQLLASLANDGVNADLAMARAALAEVQALAQEAAANADRARAMAGSGAMSAQQISQLLTGETAAQARVASAKAQLQAQELRLRQTRVLAPDSGVISARMAMVGAVVGPGSDLFRLIRQGRLEWRGEVTAAELSRVRQGMAVRLTAPGGESSTGKVRMVAPTVDPQTRQGLVYVDFVAPQASGRIGNQNSSFKPGVFARGELALGQAKALTVPHSAVVVRDGFSFVYRVDARQRVHQLKVKTGALLGERIELVDGVTPKDQLVASGAGFLSDGDLVRVVPAPQTLPAASGK